MLFCRAAGGFKKKYLLWPRDNHPNEDVAAMAGVGIPPFRLGANDRRSSSSTNLPQTLALFGIISAINPNPLQQSRLLAPRPFSSVRWLGLTAQLSRAEWIGDTFFWTRQGRTRGLEAEYSLIRRSPKQLNSLALFRVVLFCSIVVWWRGRVS
jgi:hypothetical protein